MSGKAHMGISALLCQCFAILVFKDITPIPLIIGAFFGLMADIDEEGSKISYLLIKGFGGQKKDNKNKSKKIEAHNKRVKFRRQVGLSSVLVAIGIALLAMKLNIFFTLTCLYIAILPWTPHRSLSHSLFSSLVVGGLLYMGFTSYSLGKYGIYCGVGYFLHIAEDSFTKTGTPLFYPFSKRRFKIPLMSTGTTKGKMVEMGFVLVSLLVCIMTYISAFR